MTKDTPQPGCSGGGFHAVHPERDLVSNWEVDLAKKLEEYLLKICSGEITGEEEGQTSVNFAEAALLLQGSIQVYSRKVEYLYTLVLRALEFLSQKRQQDHLDGPSVQPEETGAHHVADEENDQFWGLDDIPVEEKISLDNTTGKEVNLNHFVKPPANLVVLEGDCLDVTGDGGGELESYLLATTYLYQDFILLDTSDAVAIQDQFLKGNKAGTGQNGAYREGSTRKSFHSPTRCSGGTVHKPSAGKSHCSPQLNCTSDANNGWPSSPASAGFDNCNYGLDMNDGCNVSSNLDNSDDDDNPWKPLNPHEPGNLRVKPFRKVKAFKRNGINATRRVSLSTLFPLAKLHGPISLELMEMWEMRRHPYEQHSDSQSPPLYEKLRQSLINGGNETSGTFCNPEDFNDDIEYDGGNPDFDMPDNVRMDEDILHFNKEHDNDGAHVEADEGIGHIYPNSQESLEDLCRCHLDALLTSIAETEKQTEMASRVSRWKQKIEHNFEEQESHPPFDIHYYGDKILDKLSFETSSSVLSFSEVVKGREKYEVARSFSALLQLVNNGDVDLERDGVDEDSVCYTAVNPFHVRLLNHKKKREGVQLRLSKKREKSPTKKTSIKGDKNFTGREKSPTFKSPREYGLTGLSPPANCKFSVKLGKVSATRCSPEGKRRRRSQYVGSVNLRSAERL